MKNGNKVLFFFALLLPAVLFLSGTGGQDTVYVSNSGTKYHRENCSSLRLSKNALTLDEAVNAGYEPCAICEPPILPGFAALYRVNAAGVTTSAAADTARMIAAEVIEHVDGDTVKVHIANPLPGLKPLETIRMLGVDTPETSHPNRPVEAFAREASDYTRSRLLGRAVLLAFDWDLRDHYGRLLAYIYTDGGCFNARLVAQGYGFAYTSYPFQFAEEFREFEQKARREKLGLWSR